MFINLSESQRKVVNCKGKCFWLNKEGEWKKKQLLIQKQLALLFQSIFREVKQNVSEKSIKNWTPWMILGCLYYTMYIVHRSGGTVLNSVGTSKSKTINVIKVRTFWEAHKIWKKSSSWFGRLLSKCIKHEEDCANFCLLLRKSEL